ncbi:MAG: L-rhamnose mutarotase [Cyclobacteriaceae bacterium]
MKQVAFTMKLIPGNEKEYERRHQEIWPELSQLLKSSGIVSYHIFLDRESGTLFAFQELTDDAQTAGLSGHPVMKKWWAHMADIMETNPDFSPKVKKLETVFTL